MRRGGVDIKRGKQEKTPTPQQQIDANTEIRTPEYKM